MNLTIAIINYNTRALLERCLASLFKEKLSREVSVLVIDNGSNDGSASFVKKHYQHGLRLITNRKNMGFAHAVNQVFKEIHSQYYLILNADIEICPRSISILHDFMENNPQAGLCGGMLLDSSGAIQYSCRHFYTPMAVLLRRTPLEKLLPNHPSLKHHLMSDWDHREVMQVDWVQGACMMFRRKAIEEVGSLDERFFLYFEDVDICKRMAQQNWAVYYVPEARFIHAYQRVSKKYIFSRERIYHLQSAMRYFYKWHIAFDEK